MEVFIPKWDINITLSEVQGTSWVLENEKPEDKEAKVTF